MDEPYYLDKAQSEAKNLEDEKLEAALRLAKEDQRWKALFQPPLPVRNRIDVTSDEGNRLHAMCPYLYRATLSQSINEFKYLLGFTEDTTHTSDDDHSCVVPLQTTTEGSNRHWGGTQCLLQEVTAERNTVLHIAAEQGHVELVELIILRDNNLLLSQNSKHETPLHLAARAGRTSIVSLIIFLAQKNSHIGAYNVLTKRSINQDTVLHEAARHGHLAVVKVLTIAAPALSASINDASMSPLYIAAARKSVGVVEELLKHTHASAAGPNKQNALHAAVLGSQEIASRLLAWKDGFLANERDSTGSTPMHYAASAGDVNVVSSILDRAPLSVYIQDQEGSSPLHVAAGMGHFTALDRIIRCCPDSFELRDKNGRNFLHIVSQYDCRQIKNENDLKKMITIIKEISRFPDLKKIVNERDNDGNTPLHLASINGFSEAILELLAKNSELDTTLMNNEGKTALDYAASPSRSFSIMAGAIATLAAYGAIFSPQRLDKLQNWAGKTKWMDKMSKNLIVVSVLIATISFSAAFNVPGSYSSDGVANLRRKIRYQFFLILDAIAMSTSMSAAILLVIAKAVSKRVSWVGFSTSLFLLWTSLYAMQLAFVLAVSMSLGYGRGRIATAILIVFVTTWFFYWTVTTVHSIGSPTKLGTMIRFRSAMKEQTPTSRRINMQFPELASYVRRSNLFILLNILFYIATLVILYVS